MNYSNPFFEELEKIANVVDEGEEMNPDQQTKATDAEVAEQQQENTKENEKKANEEEELREVVASVLPSLGAFATILEFSKSDEIGEEFQKEASARLEFALQSEEQFEDVISKTAGELFADEDSFNRLCSKEGMQHVLVQLASFIEDEELEKQANEGESVLGTIREKVVNGFNAVNDFVKAKTGIEELSGELTQANNEVASLKHQFDQATQSGMASQALEGNLLDANDRAIAANKALNTRKALVGLGAAGLVGGAIAGGKALHNLTHQQPEEGVVMEEQVANEDDLLNRLEKTASKINHEEEQVANTDDELVEKLAQVLSQSQGNDTLKTECYSEYIGGHDKMSKELVRNFLKIAGASGLISIANNEQVDMELRKEASDTFDQIASLGRSAMEDALVKVAQDIYTEDQLHEIVAGHHTEELFSKVAFFTEDIHEMSAGELEKVANAGGVAAKGVAGALTDAKKEIEATIDQDKKKTEGEGRQYVGDTSKSGKVGGGLVGGTEGYNVINNPAKYDIEQTAAALEEAVLAKHAAAETFQKADAFIKEWAPKVYGK